jgi:hypothetical protein
VSVQRSSVAIYGEHRRVTAPRRRLRVRWLMVIGYVVVFAMSWLFSICLRDGQWAGAAVAFAFVTAAGLFAAGRR